jgi:hypothetical protein
VGLAMFFASRGDGGATHTRYATACPVCVIDEE